MAPEPQPAPPSLGAIASVTPETSSIAIDPWVQRIERRLRALEDSRDDRALPPPGSNSESSVGEQLETLARSLPRSTELGIAVRDLSTGRTIFEWQDRHAINPASNQKLVTAATALELLGPDYRWQTRVLHAGDTLVLVGEGDPSLQVEHLEALAERIADATDLGQIRRIVVDDSAFSGRRLGPGYGTGGPGVSYMAPSGALSLQWNTVEISLRGARAGEPLNVWVSPPSAHIDVRSSARGGRGTPSVRTWPEGEHTVVEVQGRLAAGRSLQMRRRVGDPGIFTGSTFARLLRRHGASSLTVTRGRVPADAEEIAVHHSAPLPEVLRTSLSYSNNFASEQILRTLGWRMTGEPGDWTNGRLALRRYWAAAGLPEQELHFENAAGLSSRGRTTAGALADLLVVATRPDSPAASLPDVLPLAGREGTLRGRLRRSKGRVNAKTGTLAGASALTGVVRPRGGNPLGFSVLVAGRVSASRSRRLQDRVVMTLVEHQTPS